MSKSDKLLRGTLRANGVFSLLTGLVAAIFSGSISEFMGIAQIVPIVVGVGVFFFGIGILLDVRRAEINLTQARFTVIADVVWVVVAAVLVIGFPDLMTTGGNVLLGLISVAVAIFGVLQAIGLRRTRGPKRLVTQIEVNAKPEAVWEVLADLEAFSEWNPFIVQASGNLVAGEPLRLLMGEAGGRQMTIKPAVTIVEPARTLEWLGHLGPTGVFDGRHRFDLESNGERTLLTHSEEFGGLLVPLLAKTLDGQTLSGFRAMNQALKGRVERLQEKDRV